MVVNLSRCVRAHLHGEMDPTISLVIDRTMHVRCVHTHPVDLTICYLFTKTHSDRMGASGSPADLVLFAIATVCIERNSYQ